MNSALPILQSLKLVTIMIDRSISQKIEQLLVARNPRGMQTVRQALEPGYLMRGANMIKNYCDTVLIGTGFPVDNTFETDGPPGAIALYKAIEALGGTPILACCDPLAKAIQGDYNVHTYQGFTDRGSA